MANTKRILFVLNNFTFGGVQVQALYIGEIYRRAGHEVEFWCTKGNTDPAYIERLKSAGIRYRICTFIDKFSRRMIHPRFWLYLPKVYVALRAGKFDLILPFSFHVSVVMNAFYKVTGNKECYFMERIGAPFFQNYNLRLDDYALRNTSGLITNSWHAARDFAAFYKLTDVPVKVIHNAVSIRTPRQDRAQWRTSLGIPDNAVVVTMIANLTQIKDHITLLRAWQKYQAAYTDIPTFLVLAGLQYNDKHSDAFNAFVRENTIPNYTYIGSTPDSAGLIQASEVGVLSSLAEGCPNIVLEFMAFEKAFIGTSIPGILEVLPEESKGFTFPIGDENACMTLLRDLISDAAKRKQLGQVNKAHVNNTFTEEKLKAAYLDLVES